MDLIRSNWYLGPQVNTVDKWKLLFFFCCFHFRMYLSMINRKFWNLYKFESNLVTCFAWIESQVYLCFHWCEDCGNKFRQKWIPLFYHGSLAVLVGCIQLLLLHNVNVFLPIIGNRHSNISARRVPRLWSYITNFIL